MQSELLKMNQHLLPHLQPELRTYWRFGDKNPLHYFGIRSGTKLDSLLETAKVRLVPGAVIATALYNPEAAPGSIFTFQTPTPFDAQYQIKEREMSKPPGMVAKIDTTPLCERVNILQVRNNLYGTIGELWATKGVDCLANDRVPMVTAISVNAAIPPDLAAEKELFDYGAGQVAIATIPYKLFARGLRDYLSIDPNA